MSQKALAHREIISRHLAHTKQLTVARVVSTRCTSLHPLCRETNQATVNAITAF